MRVLDLFAGIGGFSLAAHWMGWETVAFVEKEPFCQKVLRKNFGQDIDIHDDIFDFSGEPFRGRVDIISGGFPCQPFSAAGKRKGRNDERHLFPEMLRVIREVQPRWVVAENVRGLLSIESGRVYAEVIASLESEGFEVVTFCVPASAVEAPHRRDRLWIIAHADRIGKHSGHREIQEADGEISERYDDAELGNAEICVAPDADNSRGRASRSQDAKRRPFSGERQHTLAEPSGHGEDAPNPGREYEPGRDEGMEARQTFGASRLFNAERCREDERAFGNPKSTRQPCGINGSREKQYGRTSSGLSQWDEPWPSAATRLCRVDDVVPNRVDRLKCLGNTVVPIIPYEIFKAIEETEK